MAYRGKAAGNGDLGSVAELDTGTAIDEVPTNADLGNASLATIQTAPTDLTTGRTVMTDALDADGNVWGVAHTEHGTNANGRFCKYPDGSLVCTWTMTTFLQTAAVSGGHNFNDATLTFPHAFIAVPDITTGVVGGVDFTWTGTHGAETTTTFSARLLGNTTAATGKIAYIARGAWK